MWKCGGVRGQVFGVRLLRSAAVQPALSSDRDRLSVHIRRPCANESGLLKLAATANPLPQPLFTVGGRGERGPGQ